MNVFTESAHRSGTTPCNKKLLIIHDEDIRMTGVCWRNEIPGAESVEQPQVETIKLIDKQPLDNEDT